MLLCTVSARFSYFSSNSLSFSSIVAFCFDTIANALTVGAESVALIVPTICLLFHISYIEFAHPFIIFNMSFSDKSLRDELREYMITEIPMSCDSEEK